MNSLMKISSIVLIVLSSVALTGCIEDANNSVISLTKELIENTNCEFKVAGEYAYFQLEGKQLKISSNGAIDIVVEVASGSTELSVTPYDGGLATMFVNRFGVKTLADDSVDSSAYVKEALVWKTAEELRSAMINVKEIEDPNQ